MAQPNEKLAKSLKVLRNFQQESGIAAIESSKISRSHRERLMKNGYLKEVAKGWYISVNPEDQMGESTAWYTSFWSFCSKYIPSKYGKEYTVSADQSLIIQAGNWTVPDQLIVNAIKGTNKTIQLLLETSLLILKSNLFTKVDIEEKGGVNCLTLESSLIHCSPKLYKTNPIDIKTALSLIKDASEINRQLLKGSHSVVAGRLSGAFRFIGSSRIADDIVKTMESADYKVVEVNPFEEIESSSKLIRETSPYVSRIKLMWEEMRNKIIELFPEEPGISSNTAAYLKSVDDLYATDAYHSLSIEQYVVSGELIEKVKSGTWDLENEEDKKHKDAMAARGYYQATLSVKESIKQIIDGENSGKVVDLDHGNWYRELFNPSVTAGIIDPSDLAGYRNRPVYISNSKHVPMNKDAVVDSMFTLFELLQNESQASVRAVLGHFIFVFIHPYVDGNGRMGRFLMNSMLASGGYPWTVIPVEEKTRYMRSLEEASTNQNIAPFAEYLAYLVENSLRGTPIAKSIKTPDGV